MLSIGTKIMIKSPKISILMNCFNGDLYLKEAVHSIIKQTFINWELIFWNNKSSDKSLEIISKFKDSRIKVFDSIKFTNLGQARKNAFERAEGDYLAFLDVDDIWYENKLERQLDAFKDKNVGICYTNTHFFSKKNKEVLYKRNHSKKLNIDTIITKYPFSLETIMLSIKKIKELKYSFDSEFGHISDYDLIVRLAQITKIKYIDEVLSGWRIHNDNETFNNKQTFLLEKEKWSRKHLKTTILEGKKKELKELLILIRAEKRIYNYELDKKIIRDLKLKNFSNLRNLLFVFFSLIPILPLIVYKSKEFRFKKKWF